MSTSVNSKNRVLIIALCLGLLVLALGVMTTAAAPAATCTTDCYVSTTGNDANDGSETNPLLTIQAAVNQVNPGGTVHVAAGTYTQSPKLNKSLVLKATDGRDATTINLVGQPIAQTYLGSIQIDGDTVTIDGFTIVGFDADCDSSDGDQPYAASNIMVTTSADNVTIKDNRLKVGQVGACTAGDDGIGIANYYSGTDTLTTLVVENNIFEPATANGGRRAFYINPGTVNFTFNNNAINGLFTAGSFIQAKNSLVEGNTITGTGSSGGIGTWGYPDPSQGYGKTTFRNNSITGTVNGIAIYETNDVTLEKNILNANQNGVRVGDFGLSYNPSTIDFVNNAITNNTTSGVTFTTENATLDASCTWWGSSSGPGAALNGQITYTPWLVSSDLNAPCGAQVKLTSSDSLVCNGGGNLSVDFSGINNLYGYEFKVKYNDELVSATGAFVNSWFNTVGAFVPPGWNGACSDGTCQFAASLVSPKPAVNGGGTVATVNFAMLGGAGGTFVPTIENLVLTDRDGFPIAVDASAVPPTFTACGTTTVSGKVSLQGRTFPIDTKGVIKLVSADFPPTTGSFGTDGTFSVPNVPVHPNGTNYQLQATHILYVGNVKFLTLSSGVPSAGHNTMLRGGDANNGGLNPTFDIPPGFENDPLVFDTGVNMTDLGCIGGAFGQNTGVACGTFPDSSTDINADNKTNIQDLSLAGGNFDVHPFQPW